MGMRKYWVLYWLFENDGNHEVKELVELQESNDHNTLCAEAMEYLNNKYQVVKERNNTNVIIRYGLINVVR
ncbi:hypothetical protein [Bacteroides togonis]|uniref:hypothetical protein n=1 Tax=Bacteroides togonis TaxID=1917883 RepID=UPI00094AAA88|nr:hypothetical protein [Bacteroides togonis]